MDQQLEFELPEGWKFSAEKAKCPHCTKSISGLGPKSLHTYKQAFLCINAAAIELRLRLKLRSKDYALLMIFCSEFDSFRALTQSLLGKYNAANAQIKQVSKLVERGYITRAGRPGKKSSFKLTVKGQMEVDKVLAKHGLL